ncbi:conserved protein, unknown function [Hepatocystis sp. ex Piliocolobus tephrosceles]|nr:conserved protein, unknown function [Hepatocystis sp. ex Piliocolobus tephrosceles]
MAERMALTNENGSLNLSVTQHGNSNESILLRFPRAVLRTHLNDTLTDTDTTSSSTTLIAIVLTLVAIIMLLLVIIVFLHWLGQRFRPWRGHGNGLQARFHRHNGQNGGGGVHAPLLTDNFFDRHRG